MPETLHIETPETPRRKQMRFPLLSIVVALAVLAGFYFWAGGEKPRRATVSQARLPFGPGEREYAPKIQIENIALSRAENFFHQEVTTLTGELVNTGNRSIQNVELTIEFSDELHQVILRETRTLFGRGAPTLAASGRREFEVSFEHVPSSWNMERPSVTVTGLQFALAKE
jgi:hypothetical protein